MSSATKLAIVDKLLPMLEAFGASRQRQTELRRSMRQAVCTHDENLVDTGEELRVVPCFSPALGRTPWCDACRQHDQFFSQLMAERRGNKKRLHKIERLAVAYAAPEPLEAEEPKALLELIHQLEQEEVPSADTAILREGAHKATRR